MFLKRHKSGRFKVGVLYILLALVVTSCSSSYEEGNESYTPYDRTYGLASNDGHASSIYYGHRPTTQPTNSNPGTIVYRNDHTQPVNNPSYRTHPVGGYDSEAVRDYYRNLYKNQPKIVTPYPADNDEDYYPLYYYD